jgi:hypothetical protein
MQAVVVAVAQVAEALVELVAAAMAVPMAAHLLILLVKLIQAVVAVEDQLKSKLVEEILNLENQAALALSLSDTQILTILLPLQQDRLR